MSLPTATIRRRCATANLRVPIFEDPPQPGNGFYLGYHGNLAAHTLVLHVRVRDRGDRRRPRATRRWPGNTTTAACRTGGPWPWRMDTTGGLNRARHVIVHIPATSRPRELDRRRATWLRCRVTETRRRQRPYTASPRIRRHCTRRAWAAPSMASHSEVIQHEMLGRSDGTPHRRSRSRARRCCRAAAARRWRWRRRRRAVRALAGGDPTSPPPAPTTPTLRWTA